MAKFVSREKLSKKARKELDNQKRAVWAFSPTTRKVDSKKLYSRKKSAHAWKDDFGMGACCFGLNCLFCNKSLRIRRGHKGFVGRVGYRACRAECADKGIIQHDTGGRKPPLMLCSSGNISRACACGLTFSRI